MNEWYVLRSKPHKEDFLYSQLLARQMEVYYPRIKAKAVNPRARKIKPYFPGYLFIRLDIEQVNFLSLQWLPGAAGLVLFDGIAPMVPEGLMIAIQNHIVQLEKKDDVIENGFKQGDLVKVETGPFAGYDAIFDESLSGNERVRVLLKMLGSRQMIVELPAQQINLKHRS